MSSLHAQDIEDAEFLLPLLYQEAVGVKQKYKGKYGHYPATQPHGGIQEITAQHILQARVQRQGFHDIKHGHRHDTGKDIRNICPAVLFDVSCRQLQEKASLHDRPPPIKNFR